MRVAVIGLGQFGQTLAESLTQQGAEVLAIDQDEKIIEDFKDKVALAVTLDATDEDALMAQDIKSFDTVIIAFGESEFFSTILVTALLKKMGVSKVVARGIRGPSGIEERILELVGADRIVLSSVETAKRLAQEVMQTSILSYIPISAGYSMIKLKVPKKFIGKSIKDLKLRDVYKVNLIGIKRGEQEINYLPRTDDVINEDDILFIIGKEKDLEKLGKLDKE